MDILGKIRDVFEDREFWEKVLDWNGEAETEDDSDEPRFGDVICISRGLYDHYGVYASDSSVIHFSSPNSDIGADNEIRETDLDGFKRGDSGLRKLVFPKIHLPPRHVPIPNAVFHTNFGLPFSLFEEYRLRSPAETVARARSKLGERSYNLIFNNCEHFAIWCKTGVHESHQVSQLLELIFRNGWS